MATNCVWLDSLAPSINETTLGRFFNLRYGQVSRVVVDKRMGMALVFFYNIEHAQKAVQEMKNGKISGRRPKVSPCLKLIKKVDKRTSYFYNDQIEY